MVVVVGIAPEEIERNQRVEKVTRSAAVQRELVDQRVKPERAVAQCWNDPKRDSREQDLRLPERERRAQKSVGRWKSSIHVLSQCVSSACLLVAPIAPILLA